MAGVLSVEGLYKTYDLGFFERRREVLRGLSFEVERGEIFGFLGPNGAGKTTTIKAITGIVFPDRGEIRVCGLSHSSLEARRKVGFMPENPYFYNHLTGREFLRFYGALLGLASAVIQERSGAVLERVGMTTRADAKMRTYSKGMLQRVALAQALLGSPEVLILDEPMSGLDPLGRRDLREIILEERERGTTIFFSSHIIPDVEHLCDRVAILRDGQVGAIGSVREIVGDEFDAYDIVFSGVGLDVLKTAVLSSHASSGSSQVRVEPECRDAVLSELAEAGAHLISVTPLRRSLEDQLVRMFRGASS